MSGFTIVKDGPVQIEHLSTSSLIKITILFKGQDNFKHSSEEWFTYEEFSALKRAINMTDDWL